MKSILIPVEKHVLIQPLFETALLLGRALDGYTEGMAIMPNMPPYIASDIAIGDISFFDPEVRRERAGACAHSRLRHFVSGAATCHILSNTTVPVLLAH